MLQRLRNQYHILRDGINNGFIAGGAIVFLILIGLPAGIGDRAAIAPLSLPAFVLIMIALGVITANHFVDKTWGLLIGNGIAVGFCAALVFVLFMSLINRWQASPTINPRDYFYEVTLATTERLSGVSEAELFPNPPLDPITQEFPEDARLRTNPMTLRLNDDNIAAINLGFLKIGGIYGTALVLGVVGALSALIYRIIVLVDWQKLRDDLEGGLKSPERETFFTKTLPMILQWIRLMLPVLLFIIFWCTIQINYDTDFWRDIRDVDRDAIIDLNMGIRATQNLQLTLSFVIIITILIAWRSIKPRDYSNIPYLVRVASIALIPVGAFLLAIWRIRVDEVIFISPTIEILALNEVTPLNASTVVAILVAFALLVFAILGTRDSTQFESIFVGVSAISLLLTMPLFMDQYQTAVLNLVAINIMLGLGLNIVVGYAGLLDLGYVAFFAIGAYVYAFVESDRRHISIAQGNDITFLLITAIVVVPLVIGASAFWWQQNRSKSTSQSDDPTKTMAPLWKDQPSLLISLGLVIFAVVVVFLTQWILESIGAFEGIGRASPFLLGLLFALLASAFTGLLLGFPVLRLRSDYLAIVTLGFGEIISISLLNLEDLTGGSFGAGRIPKPLPDESTIAEGNLVILYLAAIGAAFVSFISLRLRSSRLGRAWTALRSDEDIAQAMGINLVNAKLSAFAIGAAFAGIAGVLFAARQSSLFPAQFTLNISINVLALVIIGGMGSVPGIIVGAIALVGLPEMLRAVQDYRVLMFGALLVIMMLVRPKGLMPTPLTALEDRARQLRTEHNKESETSHD